MCYANLKLAVLAVEENNSINDAKWSDWSDAFDIATTYKVGALNSSEVAALNRAIKSNGETVDADMSAAQTAEYGVEFNTWRTL